MAKKTAGKEGAGSDGTLKNLAAIAMRLPGVEQGVACEGTVVESRTMKVRGKAFLFLRAGQAMLKLGNSLLEAAAMEEREPGRVRAGAGGWVKVMFESGPPAMPLMERWIRESYGVFAAGSGASAAKSRRKPATGKRSKRSPTRTPRGK